MSLFELAIPIVLRREGGFVNNVNDPGGATNFGVSLRWLKSQNLLLELEHEEGDLTQDEVSVVKDMTQSEAESFYKTKWWDVGNYSAIIPQAVGTKVFDTAVNVGPKRAVIFAQQALLLTPDGVLGPKTLTSINATNSITLLNELQHNQADFYTRLVASNPARQPFLKGWLARAYDKV